MNPPPRLPERLIRRLLPGEIAEALLGDLAEVYARRRVRDGRVRAALWYWWQAASLPYGRLRRSAKRLGTGPRGPSDTTREEGTMGDTTARMVQELKVAARSLARRPLFSGIVVATLAASLGAGTLLFSVLEGVLLRPLPFPDPRALVNVHATSEEWRTSDNAMLRRSWDTYGTSLRQVEALAASPALAALGATTGDRVLVREGGPAAEVRVERTTAGVFDALGVEPALGRLPSADEHAAGAPVVVLSHAMWTERLGADPGALGRAIELDGEPWTVVGVMPPGFSYPYEDVVAWTPLTPTWLTEGRTWHSLYAIGRLAPGVEPADAAAELAELNHRLIEEDPETHGVGVRVVRHLDEVVGNVRKGLALLTGTVVLVLLLACVNLANLLVARSARRQGEIAVRASLGAGQGALLWAVAAEVALLCAVGGGLGIGAAVGLLDPFVAAMSAALPYFPRTAGIRINVVVLGFAALAVLVTSVGAALPVGLAAVRGDLATTLRRRGRGAGSRRVRRTQRALLFAETALAVLLLAGAGLLTRSFVRASTVDPGYAPGGLVFADIHPGSERYAEAAELHAYYGRLLGRLAAIPGVESAALASGVPSTGGTILTNVRAAETPEEEGVPVAYTLAGAGYFETMRLPVVRGRGFRPEDDAGAPQVIVLSRSAAERLFGAEDPLGRQVTVGLGDRSGDAEVVGIVGDARMTRVQREPEPHFYRSLGQRSTRSRTVLLRARGDAGPVVEAVRRVAAEVDPAVVVEELGTVDESISRTLSPIRFRTTLMGALAGLALALALVGVFGVVAHTVEEQTREIGIRMALGSRTRAEIRRVMASVAAPALLGAALGTLVAWRASGVLADVVEDEILADPLSYGVAPASLVLAALLAAWLPARRAAGVDPAEVLDGG